MKSHRPKREERRHGPDKVIKYINYIALCGWVLAFISVIIIYVAKPGYYWDRKQEIANPYTWNYDLARWYCVMMVLSFLTSLVGIYINKKRVRRRKDIRSFNLIALAIISFLSIVGYFVRF